MTKLEGVLKRELLIGKTTYTLALSQEGFNLALKGRRIGLDIKWADLVNGEAALATALNASLSARIVPTTTTRKSSVPAKRGATNSRETQAAKPTIRKRTAGKSP